MAKSAIPEFEPTLLMTARGADEKTIVVTFDTATDADMLRAPRMVTIDMTGVTGIAPEIELDETHPESSTGQDFGSINLVSFNALGEIAQRYLLADFALRVEATGRPGKDGVVPYPSREAVAQAVRQGVADAFTQASLDMLTTPHGEATSAPGASQAAVLPVSYGYPPAVGARRGADRGSANGVTRRSRLWLLLVPVLAFGAVWAAMKLVTPADPVQAAVNNALRTDPSSRDEQIAITKQTLKEMGLDPGKTGDLGCLAPPQ